MYRIGNLLRSLRWKHPVKDRIRESLCDQHLKQVMAALSILGIGWLESDSQTDQCWRCVYAGYPFKEWIDLL